MTDHFECEQEDLPATVAHIKHHLGWSGVRITLDRWMDQDLRRRVFELADETFEIRLRGPEDPRAD